MNSTLDTDQAQISKLISGNGLIDKESLGALKFLQVATPRAKKAIANGPGTAMPPDYWRNHTFGMTT